MKSQRKNKNIFFSFHKQAQLCHVFPISHHLHINAEPYRLLKHPPLLRHQFINAEPYRLLKHITPFSFGEGRGGEAVEAFLQIQVLLNLKRPHLIAKGRKQETVLR